MSLNNSRTLPSLFVRYPGLDQRQQLELDRHLKLAVDYLQFAKHLFPKCEERFQIQASLRALRQTRSTLRKSAQECEAAKLSAPIQIEGTRAE